MTDALNVFDRALLRRRRDRAAANLAAHDFLFVEVAGRLAERLDEITRKFPVALDLGCHGGVLARALEGRAGIRTLVQCDLSPAMARAAAADGRPVLAADEEALPFKAESFGLVMSVLALHWVNDLPGALIQIRHVLKPDGLFLAALLGGETLAELRTALMEAELAEEGGASPRVSPFADVRAAGGLLQRAGFALPMVDVARSWGLSIEAYSGRRGSAQGKYRPGSSIALGVENLSTWTHELMHASDDRLCALTERGQHWRSETVAELGGATLLEILGHEAESDRGGCWEYLTTYAREAGIEPITACQRVLKRTCDAVALILDTAEQLRQTEAVAVA